MKPLAIASVLVVLFVSAASAQTWDPELQLKVKAVGAPRVSPDGSRVVYTVNDAVMTAERSEFVSQIWLRSIARRPLHRLHDERTGQRRVREKRQRPQRF